MDAKLVRSTPAAAGVEFRAGEETCRCWVWGNAVELRRVEGAARLNLAGRGWLVCRPKRGQRPKDMNGYCRTESMRAR